MLTCEVQELTREQILALCRQSSRKTAYEGQERRSLPRWPVGGMVELQCSEHPVGRAHFGTCVDLSEVAMAMEFDQSLPVGSQVDIAFHLPDLCLQGRGVVRRCDPAGRLYRLAVEFTLDEPRTQRS